MGALTVLLFFAYYSGVHAAKSSSGNENVDQWLKPDAAAGSRRASTTYTTCGGSMRTSSGSIRSPNYPQLYPHNANCTWLISLPTSGRIAISFQTFDMEYSIRCNYDWLQIDDGVAPSRRYCGSTNPGSIVLSGTNARIWFHSDASVAKSGFSLVYRTHAGGQPSPRPPIPTLAPPAPSTGCGRQSFSPNGNFLRIVGGQHAVPHSWPWIAAMYQQGQHICGATLIHRRWVVTAAHCFGDRGEGASRPSSFFIKLGADNKNVLEASQQRIQIERIIIHRSYNYRSNSNDIALMKLASDAQLNQYVQPICLATQSDPLNAGERTVVAGWGTTSENGRDSSILLEVALPMVDPSTCSRQYPGAIDSTMICAGYQQGGKDSCQGDSGGPMMKQGRSGQWNLHGIVSWGYGCAVPNKPGVYAKVVLYNDWIGQQIAAN